MVYTTFIILDDDSVKPAPVLLNVAARAPTVNTGQGVGWIWFKTPAFVNMAVKIELKAFLQQKLL